MNFALLAKTPHLGGMKPFSYSGLNLRTYGGAQRREMLRNSMMADLSSTTTTPTGKASKRTAPDPKTFATGSAKKARKELMTMIPDGAPMDEDEDTEVSESDSELDADPWNWVHQGLPRGAFHEYMVGVPGFTVSKRLMIGADGAPADKLPEEVKMPERPADRAKDAFELSKVVTATYVFAWDHGGKLPYDIHSSLSTTMRALLGLTSPTTTIDWLYAMRAYLEADGNSVATAVAGVQPYAGAKDAYSARRAIIQMYLTYVTALRSCARTVWEDTESQASIVYGWVDRLPLTIRPDVLRQTGCTPDTLGTKYVPPELTMKALLEATIAAVDNRARMATSKFGETYGLTEPVKLDVPRDAARTTSNKCSTCGKFGHEASVCRSGPKSAASSGTQLEPPRGRQHRAQGELGAGKRTASADPAMTKPPFKSAAAAATSSTSAASGATGAGPGPRPQRSSSSSAPRRCTNCHSGEHESKKCSKPCRFFQEGKCTHGDKCWFKHVKS